MILRLFKWAAVIIVGLYSLALAYVATNQRSMLYCPSTSTSTPSALGLANVEDARIQTSDGETLRAWFKAPEQHKPVFLFFGGQGASLGLEGWRYQVIEKAGYGFLFLAYRGYEGSTGEPSERGLELDSLAAYDWLHKRVEGDRIIAHGFSLGSGVAVWLATQRPLRALILESPFTAAVDVAAERMPYFPVRLVMQDQFLSRDRIGNVHAPVFIATGKRDGTYPSEHGVKLYSLAREPKALFLSADAGHSDLIEYGLYDRIWAFLDAHPPTTNAGGAGSPSVTRSR